MFKSKIFILFIEIWKFRNLEWWNRHVLCMTNSSYVRMEWKFQISLIYANEKVYFNYFFLPRIRNRLIVLADSQFLETDLK